MSFCRIYFPFLIPFFPCQIAFSIFLSIQSSCFFKKGNTKSSQTLYATVDSGCRSATVMPILARMQTVEGIKQTKMIAKVYRIAQKIQQMRYFLSCFELPLSNITKVKQAGTQQQPTPTTSEVAFDMKVTIRRNTKAAKTKALGFIPVFFYTNQNYLASSSLFSFSSFVTCSIIYYILIIIFENGSGSLIRLLKRRFRGYRILQIK